MCACVSARHMTHVTRRTSHVTRHTSHVTRHTPTFFRRTPTPPVNSSGAVAAARAGGRRLRECSHRLGWCGLKYDACVAACAKPALLPLLLLLLARLSRDAFVRGQGGSSAFSPSSVSDAVAQVQTPPPPLLYFPHNSTSPPSLLLPCS